MTESVETEAFHKLISLKNKERKAMDQLFRSMSRVCGTAKRPIVIMIDEVDSASNHQVFPDFPAQLRRYVHQYNSPWNIAARFNMDMSFSAEQIGDMLQGYEDDRQTGMDIRAVSECIYEYTSGYPYLVSAICKFLDEEIPDRKEFGNPAVVWTRAGIEEAVKILLNENSPLFDSMVKQPDTYQDMRDMIEQILYQGKQIPFNPDVKVINMGTMFGFLKEQNEGKVAVSNRIFEMRMLNLFIAEESLKSDAFYQGQSDKNLFIKNTRLDMDLVLEKFVEYFSDIYGENDEKFIETYGRKFFLLYLKPIINGTGNYYLEAQTRDARRTDVIIDYLGEQFVVELKIWHGNEYIVPVRLQRTRRKRPGYKR